jgi:hypothetical protein
MQGLSREKSRFASEGIVILGVVSSYVLGCPHVPDATNPDVGTDASMAPSASPEANASSPLPPGIRNAAPDQSGLQMSPVPATSPLAPWVGRWRVRDYGFAPIVSTTNADAQANMGKIVTITPDHIVYSGDPRGREGMNADCIVHVANVAQQSTDDYLRWDTFTTRQRLGIKQEILSVVSTDCEDYGFKEFVVLDPDALMVGTRGVYYFLKRLR